MSINLKHILEKEDESIKLLNIHTLKNERWVKVNKNEYPLLIDGYWVSSKGRIYSEYSNRILKISCLDPNKQSSPYWKVTLQVRIGNQTFSYRYSVHRLMMCSFYPVDNMRELFVNHKDCNKLNNDLDNLEWTSPKENSQHAVLNGLYHPIYGENHVCAKITESEAKEIIKLLLSRKYTQSEIAEIVGTTESTVQSIAIKDTWKHLTKDLDFSSLKYRLPKCFTFDDINACCLYFEQHPKEENISIRRYCMNALKHINYNKPITEGALNSIRLLYKKERYKQISCNYDF